MCQHATLKQVRVSDRLLLADPLAGWYRCENCKILVFLAVALTYSADHLEQLAMAAREGGG